MKSSALDAPGANGPLTLSGPVPLPERILHTGDQISAPQATDKTVTPVADDLDFDDIILVFPPESGLKPGNDSNLLIVFYVQIMPDDLVMQLHRF